MTINNAINANSTTPLPKTGGGTGVNTPTLIPTASAYAAWDANSNIAYNNALPGYTTTVTAAGTTTLTVASTNQQFFTGSTTQTVVMPVVSTLALGQSWRIVNLSSGAVQINSSGANPILTLAANSEADLTCILLTGTSAASWQSDYDLNNAGVASITGTANQVIASNPTGNVVLSLPQDIATTSVPTFTNIKQGYTTTVTAAGTTTLTATSNRQQYFTGTTTQTVVMPVTSTLVLGQSWIIVNSSTGIVTVQSSGANTIIALPANSQATITCILTSGATASSWASSLAGGVPITTVSTQIFTADGTYTPTAGMKYCIIEVIGSGGGGGGVANSTAGQSIGAGGGGAGSYSRTTASAATIGASQTVTVGAGGTAGANTGTSGGNGGDVSVGSICIGKGGTGGTGGASGAGGAGGVVGTGDFRVVGSGGDTGISNAIVTVSPFVAKGGVGYFGGAASGGSVTGAGASPSGYGCGANGAVSYNAGGAAVGGVGGKGVVIITQYI